MAFRIFAWMLDCQKQSLEVGRKPRTSKFFQVITVRIKAIDPTAKIRPSGGFVRSALGLVYKSLHEGMQQRPELRAIDILQRIENGTHEIFNANGEISADRVRGVGSDFDVVIDTQNPHLFKEVEKAVRAVVAAAVDVYLGIYRLRQKFMDKQFLNGMNRTLWAREPRLVF